MGLEEIIENGVQEVKRRNVKKVLVYGDTHFPYHDERAVNILFMYLKQYQPDIVVINGDIADFYSISPFDKNPDHFDLQYEIDLVKEHFDKLRNVVGNKTKIYYIGDNHCTGRLQRYVYKNPELYGLEALKLENLFEFKKYKIKYIGADIGYWKKESGYLELGDVVIMHGDRSLNGAVISKYAGYSAKNTMMSIQHSVVINHCHRLAIVSHQQYDKIMYGIEAGCLCHKVPTANWQQGFVTFELYKNRLVNPKLHYIIDGEMVEDGKVYRG